MDPPIISFSSDARVALRYVGHEREPVVVIDRATGDYAKDMIAFAATRSRFQPAGQAGSGYPGLLGDAPIPYIRAMVDFVLPLIATHFAKSAVAPARARGNFSLVTTEAAALSPDQRVPHVDSVDRLQFATVHYLSPDNRDGTGFFRHRASGFETIDARRLPAYRAAIDPALASLPADGYATAATDLFDLTAEIEGAFDRMILYRAALLHSGLITRLPDHADDPRRGRLTGNLFLQCRRVAA